MLVVVLGLLAIVFARSIADPEAGLSKREVTEARMRRITDATVQYAALTGRLPCPANGHDGDPMLAPADIGRAAPEVATDQCTHGDGTVPWRTIGLRRDEGLDGWGRKISFRVYAGTAAPIPNSLTIDGGVNLTQCNSSLASPLDATLDTGSKCRNGSPPPNMAAQFAAARGNMLVVSEIGLPTPPRTGLAFVLISHGETGSGAYFADNKVGAARAPAPSSAAEIANASAGGTYWNLAKSAPGTPVGDVTHFDDMVAFIGLDDLVARAGLMARSWSQFSLGTAFTQSAVEAASGSTNIDSSMNTGVSSLAMGGFLISATSSGGVTRNVGFREQGGDDGIGVIGGSSTSGDLNSSFGEKLTFQLGAGSQYAKVDIAFNVFEITDKSPLREERAEISFWRAGLPLQSITVDAWDEHPEVSRCLFRLPTALVFDRFDVAPLSQTGGGGSSRFTVAGVRACDNNTTPCETGVPSTAACPIFPVSAATRDASGIGATGATLNARVEDNGIVTGTGSGYATNGDSYSFGERLITITGGSGTILDGNCIQVSGDATVYPVTRGITGPGEDLVIAMPGLRQSIPSSARNVTRVPCQTTVQFDWGSTCSSGYPSSTNATPLTINAGAGTTDVSAALTGLACGTPYHYRVRASNLIATTVSPNQQFRTSSCGFSTPTTVTGSPSISAGSVTFAGTINGNGESTTVSFEYGETSCYGSTVAGSPGTVAAGAGATAVIASLSVVSPPAAAGQLRCGTVYHYRVVALAGSGTRYGENVSFRTPDCP
ncbi:MAG: hypothetical protein IPJ28_04190 [Betaproteobacteria bacterium]|nr:hypothetical protein [Betaproteobacteria bacterium]